MLAHTVPVSVALTLLFVASEGRADVLPSHVGATSRARSPASAASTHAEPPPVSAAASTVDAASVVRSPSPGPRLEASYSFELGLRDFRYDKQVDPHLLGYAGVGAALSAIAIGVFPLAASNAGILSGVGLEGGYASTFGLSSTVAGKDLPTDWHRFFVGPRVRLPLGASSPLDLSLVTAYGGESFGFDNADATLTPELPAVSYRFVRSGGDVHLHLGRVTLQATAGYMAVLSAGPLADRLGDASVGGVDVTLGCSFAVLDGFELRASTGYRGFFSTFHPRAGDARIASGAVDQFGSAQLGVAIAL